MKDKIYYFGAFCAVKAIIRKMVRKLTVHNIYFCSQNLQNKDSYESYHSLM